MSRYGTRSRRVCALRVKPVVALAPCSLWRLVPRDWLQDASTDITEDGLPFLRDDGSE